MIIKINKSFTNTQEDAKLSDVMRGFWEVENSFDQSQPTTNEDQFCEEFFISSTRRLNTGAYSVRLPKIQNLGVAALGDSYERTLQRFKSLERKLNKSPEIKSQYIAFMREYANLNHMSIISSQVAHKQFFCHITAFKR